MAIDPKGLRGETTYDAAMAVLNPKGLGDFIETPARIGTMVKTLAKYLNVCDRRLLRYTFAHACLSAAWCLETDTFSSRQALRMARTMDRMPVA